MMTLQIVSKNKDLLYGIAEDLLEARLVANVFITDEVTTKTINSKGELETGDVYMLKAISKSLLFSRINTRLREQYGENMPLLYSEPIIMIDPEQTEEILTKIVAV